MKRIKYPARLTVPTSREHGKMLEELCKIQHHDRPACFIKALEVYFAQVFSSRNSEAEPLRKAG
jgi:hypothetical protein